MYRCALLLPLLLLIGPVRAEPFQAVVPMCGSPPAPCTVANPFPTSGVGPPLAGAGLASQASADSVSNFVFTAANKQLSSMTVKIGATSGYVMLLDAAVLPSNGAVTPKWCWRTLSDGTAGAVAVQWSPPLLATTGLTAAFSTTGCDTLTASATAKFMGQAN